MIFVLLISLLNCIAGQYLPIKQDPSNNLYSQAPTWYGFFPPASVRKSPWPQLRKGSANLKRTVKHPNPIVINTHPYKRWGPPVPLHKGQDGRTLEQRYHVQKKKTQQKRYGVQQPTTKWIAQQAVKRMVPGVQRPIKAVKTGSAEDLSLQKRWGPKFMVVENSKLMDHPPIGRNTQIVQYNDEPGIPEKISHFTDEPVGFEDNDIMSPLSSKISDNILQNIKQGKYSMKDVYKSFANSQNDIYNQKKLHTSENLFTRKELEKSTNKDIINENKNLRIIEDENSPNPEMEELAAKFIDTPAYKNFNVLKYIKFKEDHEKLAATQHDKLNDIKGQLVMSEPPQTVHKPAKPNPSGKLLKTSEHSTLVPQQLVDERKELIQRYLKQKGLQKKILNEKIKSIRIKAIEEYKKKGNHGNLESIADRMDEPQYKSSEPHARAKASTQSLDSQALNVNTPTRHIDVEEKLKHGEKISTDELLKRRPSLQIGHDLHGEVMDNLTAQRNVTVHTTQENRKTPKPKPEINKSPEVTVDGGITSDAETLTENEKLSPMTSSEDTGSSDSVTTEGPSLVTEESQYQPTNPIIPFKKPLNSDPIISNPKPITAAAVPTAKPSAVKLDSTCISCENLPPNTKLVPVYICCKQVTKTPTKVLSGNMFIGSGVPIKPFANPQKPVVSDVSRVQRPTKELAQNIQLSPTVGGIDKPIAQVGTSVSDRTVSPEQEAAGTQVSPIVSTPKHQKPLFSGNKKIVIKPTETKMDQIKVKQLPQQQQVNVPETSKPISPDVQPILPSEQPVHSLKGNQNPVIPPKRPPAESCSNDQCEATLMKDTKSKILQLYEQLYDRGGNHHVELYSTGCKGEDCSKAVGVIKFDGMIMGGQATGMNIVVLGYPGYELLYSKTYRTGIDPSEAKKMMSFLTNVKSPSIVLMVADGDATSAMTDDAWSLLADLGCRTSFIKTPGASFAFLGYKGTDILPWTQVNQRTAGDGTSAIFALLGSDTEYITFGGSGLTLTNLVKDILINEGNTQTREHSSQKNVPVAATGKINKTPLEAEGDFEPLPPESSKSNNNIPSDIESSMKLTNQDLSMETSSNHHHSKSPVDHGDQHTSPEDRSFEAGLSDTDVTNSSTAQIHQCDSKPCSRQIPPIEPIAPTKPEEKSEKTDKPDKPDNKTKEKPEKPEKPEKSNETNPDESEKHPIAPYHPDELSHHDVPISEGYIGHEQPHHDEHAPFIGQIVNTGHLNYLPHTPLQIYKPNSHGYGEHSPSQMYLPVHDSHEEHHDGLIPEIHASPNAHVSYGQPFENPFEVHPIGENEQHGAMVAVTPSMSMNNIPTNTHHAEGYYEPFIQHHFLNQQHHGYPASFHPVINDYYLDHHSQEYSGTRDDWHHHQDGPWNHEYQDREDSHDDHEYHGHNNDHRIPILNIPHPYVITSSTPIHSDHHDEGNFTSHPGLPVVHHIEPPYMQKAVESVPIYAPPHHEEEHHEEEHHDDEHHDKEEPHEDQHYKIVHDKPKNETEKEEKVEKKTPAPMTPEFQEKFREMLAEELSKKLKEFNILPNSGLKGSEGLSKEQATATFTGNANDQTGVSREHKNIDEHDSHDNIDVKKIEHFVHGDDDDFDETLENSTVSGLTNTSKKLPAEEEGTVKFSGPNYEYPENDENESYKLKLNENLNFEKSKAKEKSNRAIKNKGFGSKNFTSVNILKTTGQSRVSKDSHKISKDLKETPKNKNRKQAEEPTETVKYKNTKPFVNNKQKTLLTLKHIEKKLTEAVKQNDTKDVVGSKYDIKTDALSTSNSVNKENSDLAKLTDTQEEFPDDGQNVTTVSTVDGFADSLDPLAESSKTEEIDKEMRQHQSFMLEGSNPPLEESSIENRDIKENSKSSNDEESSDEKDGKICKRYKLSKSGKKIRIKLKKNCIEKSPDEKPKHRNKAQALPDASETVTALSMNPGYSTLPGAESHTSPSEVSYYFGNKEKDGLPSLKDSIYGDVTGSNIYDQGDIMNTAERLLQKDVREAYNTANDILTAEEAMDKAKTVRRKKTLYKREKKDNKATHKTSKRAKLTAAKQRKWMDEELLKTSFQW